MNRLAAPRLATEVESELTEGPPASAPVTIPPAANPGRVGARALVAGTATFVVATALAFLLQEDLPAVLFVVALPALVAAVRWPLFGAVTAIGVTQTYGWVTVGPDVSLFQLFVLATGGGVAWQVRHEPLAAIRRLAGSPVLLCATALLGWIFMAALVRSSSIESWMYLRSFAGCGVLVVLLVLLIRSDREVLLLAGALVFAGLANALLGFAQFVDSAALVSSWVLPPLEPFRTTYTALASPWGLAAVGSNFGKDILIALLLALPLLALERRGWSAALAGAIVAVLAAAMVISGSRSAWLAAVVGCAYLVLVVPDRRARVVCGAMAVVLAGCILHPQISTDVQARLGIGASIAMPPTVGVPPAAGQETGAPSSPSPSRQGATEPARGVSGERNAYSVEASNNLRVKLLWAGAAMIADHPVFGVGPGAFKDYVGEYAPAPKAGEVIDPREELPAHNVALEIWADSGTPAFLAYGALVFAILLALERTRRRSTGNRRFLMCGMSAAFLGLFVTSMFHNYQFENVFWVLCAVAAATEIRDRLPVHAAARRLAEVP